MQRNNKRGVDSANGWFPEKASRSTNRRSDGSETIMIKNTAQRGQRGRIKKEEGEMIVEDDETDKKNRG